MALIHLEILVLTGIVSFLNCQTGLGPAYLVTNVSLTWSNDFCYNLTWTPPQFNKNCEFYFLRPFPHKSDDDVLRLTQPNHHDYEAMEGGFLGFSLQAKCNGMLGEPVLKNLTYPELVSNFTCTLQSHNELICDWQAAKQAEDLHFYYWDVEGAARTRSDAEGRLGEGEEDSCPPIDALVECPAYQYKDAAKMVCLLHGDYSRLPSYFFMFNGTVDKRPARNTFHRTLHNHVRPLPLNWTVNMADDHLNINWIPPGIGTPDWWTYTINYTECGRTKIKNEAGGNRTQLPYNAYCKYHINVKAELYSTHGKGETQPGEEKVYGKTTNPYEAIYLVCIIIPVVVAAIVVLSMVCFRRHKENIFPKVPEPRILLSDNFHNNNNHLSPRMYVPAQEDEEEEPKMSCIIEQEATLRYYPQ